MTAEKPFHPGKTILLKHLEDLDVTLTEGAEILGVTPEVLKNLIGGKSRISPEMAIRLSKAFGNSPGTWLKLQFEYDLCRRP